MTEGQVLLARQDRAQRVLGFAVAAVSSLGCVSESSGCNASLASSSDGGRSAGSGSGSGSSGSSGSGGSGVCPGASMPACGPGMVCERYGAPACVDPTWAEWPMPNAPFEVEAGAPNLESYTDNGDGTVTDNVTELVWQQLTPSLNYTQAMALTYCAGLRLAGHTDWRLPSVLELVSIVDTGTYNPSIDSLRFPGTPAVGFYWSSTPFAGAASSCAPPTSKGACAWGVYFNNGYSDYNDASIAYSVRCVR